MKNRVLALCLTVALLLGMMPAIAMPTRVYAADADVNVDAVFTQETITVDGALTETSWKKATYYDVTIGDAAGKLAVVIHSGDVYVALKANATSVSAAINGKSATGTTVSGVTELCLSDVTIGSFGAVLEMTLTVDGTAITAAVTCTKNEVNTAAGTPSYLLKHGDFTAAYAVNNSAYNYYRADGSQVQFANTTSLDYINITSTATPNFSVDHSMDVEWMQELQFDHSNFPNIDPNSTKVGANRGINRIFYMCLNDSDATYGGHIFPFIYRENDVYWLQFLLPTSNSSVSYYSDPIQINDASQPRTRLKLLWHTDGSVSVTYSLGGFTGTWNFGEEVYAGTVENVTWSNTGSFVANTTVGVGTEENATQADIAGWCLNTMQEGLNTQMYLYDVQLTHIPATVAIEDGDYLGEVAVPDVVTGNLPNTVAHTYLGNLPLTWNVVDGIVAADGTVTPGLEDVNITVTAKMGDTVVVDAKSVTVKGADKLNALYTLEAMSLDNALSETSWKNSSWYAFGDDALSGSVAVVINKGKAYIAVKSAATSGTVTLAGKEVALTFANGVAEVAVADLGLTQFENNFVVQISVTNGVNTVEAMCVAVFTKTEVNTAAGTPHYYLSYGDLGSANLAQNKGYDYYRPNGAQCQFVVNGSLQYTTISGTKSSSFVVDHSMDVEWMQELQFDHNNFPNIPEGATKTGTNRGVSNILYMCLNDSDATTGGHIVPFIYRENGVYWLQFLLNTSTASNSVYSEPIQINDASQPRTRLKLLWHTDGSVSVTYSLGGYNGTWNFGEEVYAGTVENATWSANGSYTVNTDVAVGHGEKAKDADLASWCLGMSGYAVMYMYDVQLTHIPKTAAIQEGNYLGEVSVPNIVEDDLPGFVEHAYLGNLPLTWSDNGAGYVSENGAILLPEVDTVVTLTAYAGSTEVVNKEVTIKAPEKLVALATGEQIAVDGNLYETSWRYAAWKEIGGNVPGSVAVLMKGGEAYVAIKSAAATTVTVTLGETTVENVPVVNGAAEIKIADASIDTLQEKMSVAVALSDGTNTSKLKSNTVVLDKQKVSTGRTGTIINYVNTEEAGDGGSDATYRNGVHFTASGSNFWVNRRLCKGEFYVLNNSHGLSWSHNNDIYIEQYIWTNMMPVSDGMFTDTGSALTYSDGYRVHGQDHVSSTTSYAFWANIYNADEEGNLKVRVLKADKTNSEPIDLGITVNNVGGAAKVGFLWSKDGSLSVLVNGEVKGVVENATLTAATGTYLAGNAADRFYPSLQSSDSAYMYIYDFSILTVNENPTSALTQQVALGDNIGFIFKGSDISATVGENTYTGSNVTVDLAAAQMNDVVSVTVNDDSGLTYTNNYTVRDYALTLLSNNDYAAYHDMVKAMLHYGAAAQEYFDYDTGNLANDDIGELGDVIVPDKLTVGKDGTCPEGIAYYGTSLIFRNKVVIRFYFELADGYDIANYTFTDKNGEPFEVERDGSTKRYYMDIEDINPQQYDDIYTVTVGEYTVSYSCLHYITRMYHKYLDNAEKATMVNLMKAIYAYHTAAVNLLGNNNQ